MVGLHLAQQVTHACAFHLEHAHAVAMRQHLEGAGIDEINRLGVQVDAALLQQLLGLRNHRQRLQAQKVEFHQPGFFRVFIVELRHRHVGARIAIQRQNLVQRPVANHHARRMSGGVAVQPLDPGGDRKQPLGAGFAFGDLLQTRLAFHRILQRNLLAGRIGDQLGDAVDQPQRHLQHAARIAYRRARLQRSQRDDLRHAICAVFVADIAHDFVASLLAEIDVEIRHRLTFGIQKTLEEQFKPQRVQIGDVQSPRHQRRRTRSAHADGNALPARPLHEVGHDQEIAGETHMVDDAQLIGQPFIIGAAFGKQRRIGQPPLQTLFGLPFQFGLRTQSRLRHEHGQDRLLLARLEGAASRDLHRVLDRFRQVGELRRHFRCRLETVLARQAAAVVLADKGAVGDAQQRIMGVIHVGLAEMHVVGRDDGQL